MRGPYDGPHAPARRRRRARRRTGATGRSSRGSAACRFSASSRGRPAQSAWELHVSHWSGPLPQLNVAAHWTYGHSAIGVFGQFLYQGKPVFGFKSTADGNPLGRYERNVYIDTHNSAYGTGWYRESGILTHNPTGTFCHSFVPQKPFPGYPSKEMRPGRAGRPVPLHDHGAGRHAGHPGRDPGRHAVDGASDQLNQQAGAQTDWDQWGFAGDKRARPRTAAPLNELCVNRP